MQCTLRKLAYRLRQGSIGRESIRWNEQQKCEAVMLIRTLWLAILSTVVTDSSWAQGETVSGLYQIVSGRYTECCGIAGPSVHSLPNGSQSFVRLSVDEPAHVATMTFLAEDMQTVFSVIPCPPDTPISFSFGYGLILSNSLVFHVDPGPPPYEIFWNYTVTNSADTLRIDGVLGTVQGSCADVPDRFSYSNVVAVLVPNPAPLIDRIERRDGSLHFHFAGEPPNDYTVEYTDSLKQPSWLPLTTYRAKLTAIDITVTNAFTNAPARFFRLRKEPCNCD
jgi:hypothetical protein